MSQPSVRFDVRLQPELDDYLRERANVTFMSRAEYVRRLIVTDMEENNGSTSQSTGS